MSLITPEFGLIFWTVLIFGAVFFLLAKFGFPVITEMVEKRSDHIEESLRTAEEVKNQLAGRSKERELMLEEVGRQKESILSEASRTKDEILRQAREQAAQESARMIEKARLEIAADKESAMRELEAQIALISMEIAGKIVSEDLKGNAAQCSLAERLAEQCPSRISKTES